MSFFRSRVMCHVSVHSGTRGCGVGTSEVRASPSSLPSSLFAFSPRRGPLFISPFRSPFCPTLPPRTSGRSLRRSSAGLEWASDWTRSSDWTPFRKGSLGGGGRGGETPRFERSGGRLGYSKKKKFERTRGCASWTGSLPPEARPEGLRCTQRRFRSTRLADPASCSRTLSKFLISWSPRLPRLGAVPCSIRGVLLQHSCGRAGAAPRGSKACAPTPPLDVQVRGAQGGTDRTGRHS